MKIITKKNCDTEKLLNTAIQYHFFKIIDNLDDGITEKKTENYVFSPNKIFANDYKN